MFRNWLLIGLSFVGLFAAASHDAPFWLNIVYIGNSITQGVQIETPRKNAPPVKASIYLHTQEEVGEVKYSNQGVSGSTTADFLPGTGRLYDKVIEAADILKEDSWATLVFSIMLGTNDSSADAPGAPVSPETYRNNLQQLIDSLLDRYPGCLVVLHRPVWYSPTTWNSWRYLEEGLSRLNSYYPQLERIVTHYQATHPQQVFMGDTEAYDFFREHPEALFIPEEGNAGIFYLHPNEAGAARLGRFWGEAIYRVLTRQRQ